MYLDEAGSEDNIAIEYGYSPEGMRSYGQRDFRHKIRISKIAALRDKKLFAPYVFTGYCNSMLFEAYTENILLPELHSGDVVVMDNISFHKSTNVQTLIQSVGASILFLPPYSPDLNKIENLWYGLKQIIKKIKYKFDNFFDCVCEALRMSVT